jgi:tRNA-2-methylthio-N6-dimethylallyladenosine synthase
MNPSSPSWIDESRQGEALSKFNDSLMESHSEWIPLESKRSLYIESYGCQMNFSDSEIVASILQDEGFELTQEPNTADVIFINTCSIRENAEQKARARLREFKNYTSRKPGAIIGVLGCMAERLKSKFLEEEKLVDMVVGPDAYRDLPRLLQEIDNGQKAVNVLLSREETYADISPLRFNSNGISAFVSIMRGCDNMCSFCVVPFTRGRERSRDVESIVKEVEDLSLSGFKEITLLGQNVDSYKQERENATAFDFADLLEKVALVDPEIRVRFSTSHPKDITDKVLYTMARYSNICKYIHLPVQSGNSRILEMMNRTYNRDWYLSRIQAIHEILPDCGISSDFITGFCTETDQEHEDTLSLMEEVKFDYAFMFKYSERPGTLAAKRYPDDIPEQTKARRLQEIIDLQRRHSYFHLKNQVGQVQKVLIEGRSKKSSLDFSGRNDRNAMVVFPSEANHRPGMYVWVKIMDCTSATLLGRVVNELN